MKRSLLLAIAGLASAGCNTTSTTIPQDDAIVYWHWTHFDFTGTNQPLTCVQAGVDSVLIQFSDGYSATVPCSQGGVEGVTVLGFAPGPYSVQVTGYRNGQAAALYYGTATFNKVLGANAIVDVATPGIPGDLQVFPTLTGLSGGVYVPYASPACVNGAVDFLTYTVKDGFGLTLAQGQVTCTTDPPSILFSGASSIDKDDLAIRMRGWQNTVPATLVSDSCTVVFPHFGNSDIGAAGAAIDLRFPIPAGCQ